MGRRNRAPALIVHAGGPIGGMPEGAVKTTKRIELPSKVLDAAEGLAAASPGAFETGRCP
ncbi:MAG: hypothetical protein ACLGP3_10345 [Acidobacteriota bacterium]